MFKLSISCWLLRLSLFVTVFDLMRLVDDPPRRSNTDFRFSSRFAFVFGMRRRHLSESICDLDLCPMVLGFEILLNDKFNSR